MLTLQSETKQGQVVIAHTFSPGAWEAEAEAEVEAEAGGCL